MEQLWNERAIHKAMAEETLPDVPHYQCHPSGVEPKDISQHHTYNVGTAITYLMRSPYKHDHPLEDIVKARNHLNFEIKKLQG